jgi:DNA-binding NtrC family response regulator
MIEPTSRHSRTATAAIAEPLFPDESAWPRTQPPQDWAAGRSLPAATALDSRANELLSAYLDSLLNSRGVPLKDFMWDLEREILRTSLKMTHGHQKNSAAILGIKPTTMFQKMLKFALNPRRMKLTEKLQAPPPGAAENRLMAPGRPF